MIFVINKSFSLYAISQGKIDNALLHATEISAIMYIQNNINMLNDRNSDIAS